MVVIPLQPPKLVKGRLVVVVVANELNLYQILLDKWHNYTRNENTTQLSVCVCPRITLCVSAENFLNMRRKIYKLRCTTVRKC